MPFLSHFSLEVNEAWIKKIHRFFFFVNCVPFSFSRYTQCILILEHYKKFLQLLYCPTLHPFFRNGKGIFENFAFTAQGGRMLFV